MTTTTTLKGKEADKLNKIKIQKLNLADEAVKSRNKQLNTLEKFENNKIVSNLIVKLQF
jgi:hypothetical protein